MYRWLLLSNCPAPIAAVAWIESSSGAMAVEICPRHDCRTNFAAASDVTPAMFLSVQSSSGFAWQGVNGNAIRMTIPSVARIDRAKRARPMPARLPKPLTAPFASAALSAASGVCANVQQQSRDGLYRVLGDLYRHCADWTGGRLCVYF